MSVGKAYLGVTGPISIAGPTDVDKAATIQLEETLKEYNMYESDERNLLRQKILEKLDKMTKAFVHTVSERDGMTDAQAKKSGGKVLTYGSYRLGVHGRDSDIDTLCIFPSHIRRTDFFYTMLQLLKTEKDITDILAVTDTFVPVIKFKFSGISIDLVCARLAVSEVPDNINLSGAHNLARLDEVCIRSLNGTRVADDILSLVPNVATFRTTLRCIKLWAMQKAIYSNVLGFLGGVAWAILTARICQLYPNATASTVVSKFFSIMKTWDWSKALILRTLEDGPGLSHLNSWNPRFNPADKAHRMPIITPTYPHMCTTHNVSASTQRILMGELKLASQTVDKIMISGAPWSLLFEPRKFFEMHDHYIQIITSSTSCDSLRTWSGLVESKLRILLTKLELLPYVAFVHPYVNHFKKEINCYTKEEIDAVVNGRQVSTTTKMSESADYFRKIYTKTFYMGLYIRAEAGAVGSVDMTRAIAEFKTLLKNSSIFNHLQMGIVVNVITKDDLPDEVHSPNDLQQQQQQQQTKAKRTFQGLTPQEGPESKKVKITATETNGTINTHRIVSSIAATSTTS